LKDRYLHYIIYIDKDGYTLIHQRLEKDIWQHLWEFALEEQSEPFPPKQKHLTPTIDLTHVLSHQRLHARFEICRCDELPLMDGMVRVGWKELENYAFSRLTLRALAGFRL
ncbi:MAG: NUDIX domain-containing protein, partial [Paludibacteraceae bacterium]|nr:NUDIX domain-containing protein [Paludibacteraceae bacterium]